MDLAVVDPRRPDRYLLAVLGDGSSYSSGNTARDRNLLRSQVLGQLGWRIHRVWAMDWLDHPEKELRRIIAALEAAAASKDQGPSGQVGNGTAKRQEEPIGDIVSSAAKLEEQSTPPSVQQPAARETEPAAEKAARIETAALTSSRWRRPHEPVVLPAVPLPSEEFHNTRHVKRITEQVRQVIDGEGPISRSLLTRRVIQAWGMSRSGARIERHLSSVLDQLSATTTAWEGQVYYWPQQVDPAQYEQYRVSSQEAERRQAEDLPPEEVASAVREVLFLHGSLMVDDLVREAVKLLGYARTGAALDKAMRGGVHEAVRRGWATIEEDRVSYRR